MRYLPFSVVLVVCLFVGGLTKTKDEWTTRTIYQVLTDRFAKGDGSKGNCDLHDYCGGNYQGLINNLDYIISLGFDAIWISPVVDNYEKGYHGYWAKNIYETNDNFGTKDDLKAFVKACHEKGIWVMVDVVANHMGNTDLDFSRNHPFNDTSHYHEYCLPQQGDYESHNMKVIENCRLGGLADLNSESTYVQTETYKWIHWLVTEFEFDGLRIDTLVWVPKWFWKKFSEASGVYTIGEAMDGDLDFVSKYVGCVDAVLNYPQFFLMRDLFLHQKDMTDIQTFYSNWIASVGASNLPYLGNFNDNHDVPRFLSSKVGSSSFDQKLLSHDLQQAKKYQQFKTFTAFQLTSVGIPIMYYGSEQAFKGEDDPFNREVMWNSFDQSHDMFAFIKTINEARKATNAAAQPQIERYVDEDIYTFTRGTLFAAFTSKLNRKISKHITLHPYSEGQTLCNIFKRGDCVKIKGGAFNVHLSKGEVKIYTPK